MAEEAPLDREGAVRGLTRGDEEGSLPRCGIYAAGEHVGLMRLVICKASLVFVQQMVI